MQQENNQINGTAVRENLTTVQQVEWLDGVIVQLQKFKKKVSEGKVTLDGGYFDKSLNMPEKDNFRPNELRLSVDYNEIK